VSLLAVSVSISLPSPEYVPLNGTPFHVLNPQYGNSLDEKVFLFVLGFIFLVLGIGIFLYSLHKKSIVQHEISMEKEYWQKREQEKRLGLHFFAIPSFQSSLNG
jgi:hypothetical protein